MLSLQKIYDVFNKIQNFTAKILIIIMTVLVFFQAMSRVFGISLPWSMELTLLLFAWLAFLSAAQASRHNAHNGVDILYNVLPEKAQRVITVINKLLMIAFLIIIAKSTYGMALSSSQRVITSLGISYTWIVWPCLLGCILMTIIECVNLFLVVFHVVEDKTE